MSRVVLLGIGGMAAVSTYAQLSLPYSAPEADSISSVPAVEQLESSAMPSEQEQFERYTDTTTELSFTREDIRYPDNSEDGAVSDTSAYLSVGLNHWFSPIVSGYVELELPIDESGSAVETGEFYLQADLSTDQIARYITLGTQSIYEDRGWLYDSTLDLVSLYLEAEQWGLTLGAGVETEHKFWNDLFEPEEDKYTRWFGEYAYQLADSHRASVYMIGLEDKTAGFDDLAVSANWVGARVSGRWWNQQESQLDYWADLAMVHGDEKMYGTTQDDEGEFTTELQEESRVRGWGYDLGATWLTSLPGKPELTLAIAGTSKDSDPTDGTDGYYRQTGLQGNAADIGSATSVSFYGLALNPELSNLEIRTFGLTFPFLSSSFMALFYHDYRQITPTAALRDSALAIDLSGLSRDVGNGVDLLFSYEESDLWSVSLSVGFFEAGKAVQSGGSVNYTLFDFSYSF